MPSRWPESLSPFLPERCCLHCNHTIMMPLKCHIWRNPYKQSINNCLEIVVFTTNDLLSLHVAPSRHLHSAASSPSLASETDQRCSCLCCLESLTVEGTGRASLMGPKTPRPGEPSTEHLGSEVRGCHAQADLRYGGWKDCHRESGPWEIEG